MVVMDAIPVGYCQCGCGQRTNIIPRSDFSRGYVRGEPYRYISRHGNGRCHGDIDAALFCGWLREQIERHGFARVGAWAGVSADRVRILARGYYWHVGRDGVSRRYEIKRVTLELVDRFLVGAGHPELLDELAPL